MAAATSKQHFVIMARALAACKPCAIESDNRDLILLHNGAVQQWRATVKEFANVCAQVNENFNAAKFYAACNYQE